MSFEEQLRQALRPGPAPRGLADRVVAQLAAATTGDDQSAASGHAPADTPADTPAAAAAAVGTAAVLAPAGVRAGRRPSWMGLGVAASLLAAVASSALWLEHDRQRQAREARNQVLRALAITSEQLHDIQARVTETRVRSGD